jgi:hypothetical protein
MMLQYDTSDHDWLEGRGPKIKLIGGIDDATGEVPYAQFAYKDSKFITTRHKGIQVNLKGDDGETQIHGDHTISYKGKKYEILPTKTRFSFAKAYVEVDKYLDGSIHIFYQGKELKYRAIPMLEKRYVPSKVSALVGVGV